MGHFRGRLKYWLYGFTFAVSALGLYVLVPLFIPDYYPCNVPSLVAMIPSTTLSEVGTSGYLEDHCPVPVASELEFDRPYGTVKARWWGSPHRLYFVGTSAQEVPLDFVGSRVEAFHTDRPDSFLAEFSSRVTFSGGNYIDSEPERFEVDVYDDSGLRESLHLRYVPVRCECAASEGL